MKGGDKSWGDMSDSDDDFPELTPIPPGLNVPPPGMNGEPDVPSKNEKVRQKDTRRVPRNAREGRKVRSKPKDQDQPKEPKVRPKFNFNQASEILGDADQLNVEANPSGPFGKARPREHNLAKRPNEKNKTKLQNEEKKVLPKYKPPQAKVDPPKPKKPTNPYDILAQDSDSN